MADVGGDGGVHTADYAVEDAFFQTFVVERNVGFGSAGEHDAAQVVGGLEFPDAAGG